MFFDFLDRETASFKQPTFQQGFVATATLFDTAANSLLRFVWLGLHYKNQHGGTAGPAFVVSRCSFFFFLETDLN